MKCKICNKLSKEVFSAMILQKYSIKYFHCEYCNFLQTEEPYWLEEAYSNPINISDTGYVQRNLTLSKKVALLLHFGFDSNGEFLDYAGGYGLFVRLMRDAGFDFYWADKYTSNLFATGFEYKTEDHYSAITTFESFEHFVSPVDEINNLLKISKNIIFSTELLPNPIPRPEDWWYYGLEHGQHISFYSAMTLQFLAERYGLYYSCMGGLHIFSEKRLSILLSYIVNLNKLGLHKYVLLRKGSKTWTDHLELSKITEAQEVSE